MLIEQKYLQQTVLNFNPFTNVINSLSSSTQVGSSLACLLE